MNNRDNLAMDTRTSDALKELYEEDAGARRFFQWAAERQNDAAQTSIERVEQKAGVDRRKAIEMARQLEDLGCGRFVMGRRGAPSRIEWNVSLKSIGRAAIGQSVTLETVDPELVAETADLTEAKKEESATLDTGTLSIAEAKRRLAASFGVPPEAIEITIRA
jgi:hypothetical protein